MNKYITRESVQKILHVMNQFPDHDAFQVYVDNSSGIGSTVTLTIDIIHNNVAGKFTVEVEGPDNW